MDGGEDYTFIVLFAVMIIVAVLLQIYMEMKKKPKEPKTIVKTLLECTKCRKREETNYETGDVIGVLKKKCSKCGNPMKIIGIYSIEIKEKR